MSIVRTAADDVVARAQTLLAQLAAGVGGDMDPGEAIQHLVDSQAKLEELAVLVAIDDERGDLPAIVELAGRVGDRARILGRDYGEPIPAPTAERPDVFGAMATVRGARQSWTDGRGPEALSSLAHFVRSAAGTSLVDAAELCLVAALGVAWAGDLRERSIQIAKSEETHSPAVEAVGHWTLIERNFQDLVDLCAPLVRHPVVRHAIAPAARVRGVS